MSNMRQIIKRGQPSLRMADGGMVGMGQPVDTRLADPQTRMGMATSLLGSNRVMAMPTIGSQPIQMADGGMFGALKRVVGISPESPEVTAYKAEQAAKRAQPAPQPQAAAPVSQIGNYAGNTALEGRMKAAGLRDGGDLRTGHGGEVPGTGSGDKIPAKYEPGEFVVSNAMLAKEPGLAQHLHQLRNRTLRSEGKDPAAVTRKQMSHAGLRAEGAADPIEFENVWNADAKKMNPTGSTDSSKWTTFAGVAAEPVDAFGNKQFLTTGSPRTPQPNMGSTAPEMAVPQGNPNVPPGGSAEAKAFRAQSTSAASPPTAPLPGATPSTSPNFDKFKANLNPRNLQTVESIENGVQRMRNGAGALKNSAAALYNSPLAQGSMKLLAGADALGQYGDYKEAVANGDVSGAIDHGVRGATSALSLMSTPLGAVSGALRGGMAIGDGINWGLDHTGETGRNIKDAIGSGVNSVAKVFGGGVDTSAKDLIDKYGGFDKIPAAEMAAYNQHIAQRDGGKMRANGEPLPAAAPAVPQQTRAEIDQSHADSIPYNAAQAAKAAPTAPANGGVTATRQANGNMAFSGTDVSGLARNTIPGMSQEVINRTLNNPDGSRWSEGDNAIMAANLRDGVDKYRGTSRQPADDQMSQLRARAMDPNAIGHNGAMRALIAMQADKTAQRGQDITERDNARNNQTSIRSQDMTSATARSRLSWEDGWKRHDAGQAAEKQNFDIKTGSDKALHDEIAGMIPAGPDGKADTQTTSRYAMGLNTMKGNRVAQLQEHLKLNPTDAAAASELDGISKQGANVIPADMKRKYIAGMQVRDLINSTATGGLTPWGTRAVHSDAPVTSMRKNSAGEYVVDEGNGKTTVIPARYIDKVNSTFGFGGQQNANFDILKTK